MLPNNIFKKNIQKTSCSCRTQNCYPSIINTLHFNNVKEYLNLLYVKEQTEYVKIIEN